MRRFLVLKALVSTGLACGKNASVSESQCAAGDWETIGYRDGALGWRSSRLLAHQDACIPHGVTPDRAAYDRGRTLFVARDRVDSLERAIAYRTQRIEAIGEALDRSMASASF